jgi:hypothetical protein
MRGWMLGRFGILCVALLPTLASAWDLQPFTATYKFNIDNRLDGTATRTLQKNGDSWHYNFVASAPLASATETSDFRFDGSTVTPLSWNQVRKIFFVGKQFHVDYDWKTNMAKASRGDDTTEYALKPLTLDDLNLEIQIRRDLKDTGKLRDYWMGSPKDISPLQFEVVGEEVLDTPLGKLHTVKIKRLNQGPKRITLFWLAKELDYLPAKMQQNDNGPVYTLDITTYKPGK